MSESGSEKPQGIVKFPKMKGKVPDAIMEKVITDELQAKGICLPMTEIPDHIRNKHMPLPKSEFTLYGEEIVDAICSRLMGGETLRSICADPDMPSAPTVLSWQNKYPEFKDQIKKAREQGTHAIADQCIEIADRLEIDPSHKRVMVETRLKLIKSWNSRVYGDNVKLSGDENGSPVRFFIDGLSDRDKPAD